MDFVLPTFPTYYNTKSLHDYMDSDLLRYFNEHSNFSFLNKFIIIAESFFEKKNEYKEIKTLKNTYGNAVCIISSCTLIVPIMKFSCQKLLSKFKIV